MSNDPNGPADGYAPHMARPYKDGAELATEPAPRRGSASADEEARTVVGVWYPGATEPLPLVLLPGFEYRIRVFYPTADEPRSEPGWTIERRKAAHQPPRPLS